MPNTGDTRASAHKLCSMPTVTGASCWATVSMSVHDRWCGVERADTAAPALTWCRILVRRYSVVYCNGWYHGWWELVWRLRDSPRHGVVLIQKVFVATLSTSSKAGAGDVMLVFLRCKFASAGG